MRGLRNGSPIAFMEAKANFHQGETKTMRSTILRKSVYVPLLALGLTTLAPAAVTIKAPAVAESLNPSVENEASRLLKQVKALSGELKATGERLEGLTLPNKLDMQDTHAYELTEAREHINAIGKRLDRLQAIQSAAAPWQQNAIDEIVPVAANIAAHTQSAIEHLNENRGFLYAPAYADYLAGIAQQSSELKSTVDAYLDFASTSDQHQKLQQKLDRIGGQLNMNES